LRRHGEKPVDFTPLGREQFLRSVRYRGEPAALKKLAGIAGSGGKKTAAVLRERLLAALDGEGSAGYNLGSELGLEAYLGSVRHKASGLSAREVKELAAEGIRPVPAAGGWGREIRGRYRSAGGPAVIERRRPKGEPERIVRADRWAAGRPGVMKGAVLNPALITSGGGAAGSGLLPDGVLREAASEPVRIRSAAKSAVGETAAGNGGAAAIHPASVEGRKEPGDGVAHNGDARREAGQARRYPGRDAELERLRRIEANYERDKAMLAREKVPALARSESRDIGHAEGSGEEISHKQVAHTVSERVVEMLKRRAGV
jgi:hypothetical protein